MITLGIRCRFSSQATDSQSTMTGIGVSKWQGLYFPRDTSVEVKGNTVTLLMLYL